MSHMMKLKDAGYREKSFVKAFLARTTLDGESVQFNFDAVLDGVMYDAHKDTVSGTWINQPHSIGDDVTHSGMKDIRVNISPVPGKTALEVLEEHGMDDSDCQGN